MGPRIIGVAETKEGSSWRGIQVDREVIAQSCDGTENVRARSDDDQCTIVLRRFRPWDTNACRCVTIGENSEGRCSRACGMV